MTAVQPLGDHASTSHEPALGRILERGLAGFLVRWRVGTVASNAFQLTTPGCPQVPPIQHRG